MNSYEQFREKMRKIADVNAAGAVLGWDQETYMPEGAAQHRAQQSGTLAGIAQELLQETELKSVAESVCKEFPAESDEHMNALLFLRDHKKQENITPEFAAAFSRTTGEATSAWQKAKRDDDFAHFEPHLERVVMLSREKAQLMDPTRDAYETLIDMYEPGARMEVIDRVFVEIKEKIIPLYKEVHVKAQVDHSVLEQKFDKEIQQELMREITEAIGYDYSRGRADLVEHPFCTTFSPEDVRITSRIKEGDVVFGLWSSIHEAGHAMYEQGLPREHYGLPLGTANNMSIHESQSRLWENNVGRSRAFVNFLYPKFQEKFPEQVHDCTEEMFYRALNVIRPWPIRIESDELTYHIHILIRYEMEKGLISGDIAVHDAADVWKAKYKEYLNIDITSDSEGVLQDVHWSFGLLGYFPTYSLGSLYGAQYFEKASEEIDGLDDQIRAGAYGELLQWLRTNIHAHGGRYASEELCERVTGSGLDVDCFVGYMKDKLYKL